MLRIWLFCGRSETVCLWLGRLGWWTWKGWMSFLDLVGEDFSLARGMISAIGWSGFSLVQDAIDDFIESKDAAKQFVGVAGPTFCLWVWIVCSTRRLWTPVSNRVAC
jgi:hypothetical protein